MKSPALALLALTGACSPNHHQRALEDAAVIADAWSESEWMDDVAQLASDEFLGRDAGPGAEAARAWLSTRLDAMGLQPLGSDGFEAPFADGINLLARIPATHPSGETLLLGAHYDHLAGEACNPIGGDSICNGAADNAAGVVLVLAVADALRQLRTLRRDVVIALWDAEEDGLLGSKHYVEQPAVPLAETVAAFNVDTVGSSIFPGVRSSFALGAEYADGLREIVHTHDANPSRPVHAASLLFSGDAEGARSDHHPFRLKGLPVLFFSSGSPAEYHTPLDEISTVEGDKLLAVARHTLLVTADVASRDDAPTHRATPEPTLDDARTLLDLARDLQADPSFLGADADVFLPVVDGWVSDLEATLANPPQTDEEWAAYQEYIAAIINLVFAVAGR